MVDKVLAEIQQNMIPNPERWEQIRKKAEGLSQHYRDIIEKKRRSGDPVIHFAAYVSNDAMYGMHDVFCLMKQRPQRWDPKVVIVPDVSRGYPHQKETYLRARECFTNRYGTETVIDGWDIESENYVDVMDQFDIIYFADPYDAMAPNPHSIEYASTRDVLPIYVNYGYDVGYYTMYSRMKGAELNLVWKYFTETVYSYEEIKKLQIIRGKNAVLTGYAKMDALAKIPMRRDTRRKKILITPHHTITMEELPLSNFLSYHKLFLDLPSMFPEIQFVFRPHPLMFIRMINDGVWTKEQVDSYICALKDTGIEYSDGGEYLHLFAECDAIINDSGSFTMEWLFTGKPGCFVLRDKLKDEHLTAQMKEAIKRYKIARNSKDIIDFVSGVADGRYKAKDDMDDWVRENIAINYPHVAEKILEELDILA